MPLALVGAVAGGGTGAKGLEVYKRILLAYDGTREGLVALREGALLAKRCEAQVFLLSVPSASDMGLMMGDDVYDGQSAEQVLAWKTWLH